MEHLCTHTSFQDIWQPLAGGRVQHVAHSQNILCDILKNLVLQNLVQDISERQLGVSLGSPHVSKNVLGQLDTCVIPHTTRVMKAVLDQTCWAVARLKQAASKVTEHFELRRFVTGLEARVTNTKQVRQSATKKFLEADHHLNESLRANSYSAWYRNDIDYLCHDYRRIPTSQITWCTARDQITTQIKKITNFSVATAKGITQFVLKGGGCSRQQSCTNAGEMQLTQTLRKLGHSDNCVSGARLKHIYPIYLLRLLNQSVQNYMCGMILSRQPSCLFVPRLDCGHRSISGERAGRDVSLTL